MLFDNAVKEWRACLRACMKGKGGHFDHPDLIIWCHQIAYNFSKIGNTKYLAMCTLLTSVLQGSVSTVLR
jgi:hypothetical protein